MGYSNNGKNPANYCVESGVLPQQRPGSSEQGQRKNRFTFNVCRRNSAAPLHMTPGALPAANLRLPASSQAPCRTTARTPHARVPPSTNPLEHAQHHARNCPCPALQTAAHCAQPHQHLHSINSTRIARALACARARLPACVHPPRPADQPHPLPRDALPCLSTCALYARHTTMCSRCEHVRSA